MLFQLTLPEWGATYGSTSLLEHYSVSTHAPRVGSDHQWRRNRAAKTLFQLTLPEWGATSNGDSSLYLEGQFQLTLPEWGATRMAEIIAGAWGFQLTLPEWGATFNNETISLH